MPSAADKRFKKVDFDEELAEDFVPPPPPTPGKPRPEDGSPTRRIRREEDAMPREDGMPENVAGVFLLLIALLIAGRMALYAWAESWGARAHIEGIVSNAVFGIGAVIILIVWVDAEWQAVRWLMIPKAITIFVSVVICASAISGGALLEGVAGGSPVHPGLVALLAVAACLLAASPFWVWALRSTMRFLNNPMKAFGGKRK